MLTNRKDDVQATISRLAETPDIAAIRIYDKTGRIVMSAHAEEIGQRIMPDTETCRACHQDNRTTKAAILQPGKRAHEELRSDVLRHLSAIETEPSCVNSACHAHTADQRVLGVLDVEMSMAPMAAALRADKSHFFWATGILAVILLATVAVFIHRGIQIQRELQQAQRQVLHMEKMASLGKLSATVAHEINNPLSGMLVYAGLSRRDLQEQPLDPAVQKEVLGYLAVIERECRRCGDIVQNLLLFARRDGSSMAPVDVNEIVRRSLMLVEHHLHMSGLKLKTEYLEADSRIMADGGQLQQALVALLVNAVEAMSGLAEGQGELVVGLHGTADSIGIDISDNGIGIPNDVLPKIFEPFFSTKEAEKGVGLGLSVVYGIVERHGGRIDVDSKVGVPGGAPSTLGRGRGTTFHLTLPRQSSGKPSPPAPLPSCRVRQAGEGRLA
jgi:signal transduction histidine kinase